jgi:DNA adenine methylase
MPVTVFQFPGGKFYLIKKLLPLIPPHEVYVEVFGGAAALLFNKPPSKVEVYNDINSELVNFFHVLRDDVRWKILQEKLLLTPFSREEFELACREESGLDDVERARRFYVRIQQSFGGKGETFNYGLLKNRVSTYFHKLDGFAEFHERIKNMIVANDDFEKIIRRYDSPVTFFFLDPPYLEHSVKSEFLNMSEDDHKRLVEVLLQIEGKALLCGYKNKIYEKLEKAGWFVKRFRLPTSMPRSDQTSGKRCYRSEYVWMNYKPPRKRL